MSGKITRTYGRTAPDKASSLFDAAFAGSSSASASTSRQAPKRSSPKKIEDDLVQSRSPPIDLPFSPPSADDADSPPDAKKNKMVPGMDHDDSDDDDRLLGVAPRSQGSTASISNKMDMADLNDDDSPKRPHDAFDFDDDGDNDTFPEPKKQKSSERSDSASGGESSGVFHMKRKEKKPVYNHKWTQEDEGETENGGKDQPAASSKTTTAIRPPPPSKVDGVFKAPAPPAAARVPDEAETRVRNVKEAHQCLESGEHDDYKQDLEYLLSSLVAAKNDVNMKCLSALSLAKKCVAPEFRQFLRSQNLANKLLRALSDAHQYPTLALCTSCVVYLLARDKLSVAVDMYSLRLIVKLVQLDSREEASVEYTKCAKQVWAVLSDWRERTSEGFTRELMFDMNEETLSTSFLALESLVYISARVTDQWLKNELLNLGALQWLVVKVEKSVSKLTANSANEEELKSLERCLRIIESCTLINKKNQAFLISHKSCSLLQSAAKLIAMCHKKIERELDDRKLLKLNIDCLSGMARVLMNLTHENELCCTKLGQMDNFLRLCLSCFTFLNGKFAPIDKHFDLAVMLSSLLVNLVERCNSNRRKLLSIDVPAFDPESGNVTNLSALKALTLMFLRHEAAARTVDEELDRDLELDDAPTEEDAEAGESDDEGGRPAAAADDGRLQRVKEPTEEEMAETLQAAMNKASSHMEDSVIASYIALLVGCLVQQNEEAVATVKSLLPNDSLTPMIEQLQRFLEFMKIAHSKSTGNRSVERIIDLLERLN